MFVFFAFISVIDFPYPLVVHLDDQKSSAEGFYLSQPTDATYFEGKLYVTDARSHRVFVLNEGGKLTTFGKKGDGPGEFKHHPEHIFITTGAAKVVEWNYLRTSYFDHDGNFFNMEKRRETFGSTAELRLHRLSSEKAQATGFLLEDLDASCLMNRLKERSDKGFALSGFFLLEGEESNLFVVKGSGRVEIYERPCKLLCEMSVPLERFRADLKKNNVLTYLMKRKHPESKTKYFYHGMPILAAAAKNKNMVWILVKDENNEKPPYYQTDYAANNWLFEVDPLNAKVNFSIRLSFPANSIRYESGFLILISQYESSVSVYKVP